MPGFLRNSVHILDVSYCLQVCGGGSPTELITALRYVQAPSSPTFSARAKFRLLSDGEANICRLYDSRTMIRKIMNSRCLRRWETHHLVLGPVEIYSTTVSLVHTFLLLLPAIYRPVLFLLRDRFFD